MKKSDQITIAQSTIKMAQKAGAEEVSVKISHSRNVEIEYRDDVMDQLSEATQHSLSIDTFVNQRFATYHTNALDAQLLERFVKEAVAATKYLAADPFRKLPDPSLYPTDFERDLNIYDISYQNRSIEDRKKIAQEIQAVASQAKQGIISATGGFSDTHFYFTQMHSNGFLGQKEGTVFAAGSEVTVKDGDARPEGYDWVNTRFFDQLPNLASIGTNAATRAADKIGKQKIKTAKYPMLVENRVVTRLLSTLLSPLFAHTIQQKKSYLEGKLNTTIASKLLNITDNPFVKSGLGSRLFDGEGLAAYEKQIVENGILKNYFIDHYYGQKMGWQANGGSISNLMIQGGTKSFAELVASVPKGILVKGFNGGNFNSTTGDFSFGVEGNLIENGQITIPIAEMNITGNAADLWQKLVDLGSDIYQYSNFYRPSMLFEGIDFSGS